MALSRFNDANASGSSQSTPRALFMVRDLGTHASILGCEYFRILGNRVAGSPKSFY